MIYRRFLFLIAISFTSLCLQGPVRAEQQEHQAVLKAATQNVELAQQQGKSKKKGKSCGNGIVDVDAGEQCDDGNTKNGDGCSRRCQVE